MKKDRLGRRIFISQPVNPGAVAGRIIPDLAANAGITSSL